jgi:hypothetical protein
MVSAVAELDANRTAPQLNGKGLSGPESIYEAYPRHVGKKAALKAIERAIKAVGNDPTWEQVGHLSPKDYVLSRTVKFALAVKQWSAQDRQFIPHPATWFNQGRYADDPKEWERGYQVATEPTNYRKF